MPCWNATSLHGGSRSVSACLTSSARCIPIILQRNFKVNPDEAQPRDLKHMNAVWNNVVLQIVIKPS